MLSRLIRIPFLKQPCHPILQQPLPIGNSNRSNSNYKPHLPPPLPSPDRFNLLITLCLASPKIRLHFLHLVQFLLCIRRISVQHDSIEPSGQCDDSLLMTECKDPESTMIGTYAGFTYSTERSVWDGCMEKHIVYSDAAGGGIGNDLFGCLSVTEHVNTQGVFHTTISRYREVYLLI
jgi:hypothetical protein